MKNFFFLLLPFIGLGQTVWGGDDMTFTKSNNADFTLEENQDRITSDVWLTRGSGGGLYNIHSENEYSAGTSPANTLWAIGNTSNSNLSFSNFRDFHINSGNKPPINQDIVLKLTQGTTSESDDVFIDIRFTSWASGGGGSDGGGGGFSYTRSTDPNLGFASLDKVPSILVYPNPTKGLVTSHPVVSKILVYDLTGKQLLDSNLSSIDISAFKNGVYLFQLYRNDTKEWVNRRVVKLVE